MLLDELLIAESCLYGAIFFWEGTFLVDGGLFGILPLEGLTVEFFKLVLESLALLFPIFFDDGFIILFELFFLGISLVIEEFKFLTDGFLFYLF